MQVGRNDSAASVSRMTMVSTGNRSTSDYMISISQSDSDERSVSPRLLQVTGASPGVLVHLSNEGTDATIENPLTHRKGAQFHPLTEKSQEEIIQEHEEEHQLTSKTSSLKMKKQSPKINMGHKERGNDEVSSGLMEDLRGRWEKEVMEDLENDDAFYVTNHRVRT